MPATPKLSRKFYDTFGEDVVNELVDWFNRMDATYRADLRDMNELNFARFDATLQQGFAEADAKWERRFAELERRWAEFTSEWERRFAESDAKWDVRIAVFEARIIKWMFVMWIGTIGTLIALTRF